MNSASYTGAVLFALGVFRLVRVALPPSVVLRYICLGLAIGIGYADTAAIKATYPDAVPVVPLQH